MSHRKYACNPTQTEQPRQSTKQLNASTIVANIYIYIYSAVVFILTHGWHAPSHAVMHPSHDALIQDAQETHHVHLLELREHDVHAEPGLQRDHSLRGSGARVDCRRIKQPNSVTNGADCPKITKRTSEAKEIAC